MDTFVALSAVGAERVTGNELRKLGFAVPETGFGYVRFQTDIAGCYRALMELRTADRVLWEGAAFRAADFDALFEETRAAPWERFIPRGMGLRVVKVRSSRSRLQSVTSVQAVVHKALAERLCEIYHINRLPEGPGVKTAELRVYLDRDEARVLLDLSGEPLFKRGYRTEGGVAPLRETTAAALLFLANWRRKYPLCDPFCGSGTILLEAAMYAWDMAPGLGRRFALAGFIPADAALERDIREELRGRVNFERRIRIYGSDADPRSIETAKANLARLCAVAVGRSGAGGVAPGESAYGESVYGGTAVAGRGVPEIPAEIPVAALPDFRAGGMERARPLVDTAPVADEAAESAAESNPPQTERPRKGNRPPAESAPGFIITNPPWGLRLGEEAEAEANYAVMAVLARNFPGWKLGVITNHGGFESSFGRRADSRRDITGGAEDTAFFQYEHL